jgi:hypothetical protein
MPWFASGHDRLSMSNEMSCAELFVADDLLSLRSDTDRAGKRKRGFCLTPA